MKTYSIIARDNFLGGTVSKISGKELMVKHSEDMGGFFTVTLISNPKGYHVLKHYRWHDHDHTVLVVTKNKNRAMEFYNK